MLAARALRCESAVFLGASIALAQGCSGSTAGNAEGGPPSGGSPPSQVVGGSPSSGGSFATGAAPSLGGTEATGGSTSTGGQSPTSTGGSTTLGGASAGGTPSGGSATGGARTGGNASGGQVVGGAATGGTTSRGGASGEGGKSATGGKSASTAGATNTTGGVASTGGKATGGTTASTGGTAASTGGMNSAGASSTTTAGCGKATWPTTNDQTGSTPYTLNIDGTAREYYVNVPTTYNSNQPTRVVFAWHWLTATARSVIGGGFGGGAYYGLKSRIPDALYIAAEGLGDNGQTGWANTNGRDVAFLRAMLDWLDANYCVDKGRIFSLGFSYGGIMSDTLACQLGSTFRAIAPIAGSMFGGSRSCVNQRVAAHVTHGSADATLNISGGITARDYFISTNHCTTVSQPIEPSPCVEYSGCDEGYPVVWCEHTGGHTVPSFASAAIAAFFQRF